MVIVGVFAFRPCLSQSVHPDIDFETPRSTTANRVLDVRNASTPRIGLFFSEQVIALNPTYEETLRESIRQWEQFLIGHELPYRVLEDSSLYQPVPEAIRLLILPSAEVLSDTARGLEAVFEKRWRPDCVWANWLL